ncbi:hypothetical protein Kpol_1052p42 [Vanderwaltozyma polyspora DSM 70294]|uniref:Golgi apparatus membrane protein TVP15 n=1 Tax=Vanderwaltozyma polyspora (strain ATCC 22028 / DSM 70294 / BCRC 21397 / CBS 2163 / NBRC 10782 / NRRL Y-8283 / UCD 57-17) TaxID=436907 RepID=A7TM52_VANPO|nr:uncharacterized protein Kpol_1052p42 [Vanderwaltozyma polyspora DSM 70294]EDO16694.1 hypothetical protein Kpol_1052p42 [Vanderwaltozyma polyspora DSM 70294]
MIFKFINVIIGTLALYASVSELKDSKNYVISIYSILLSIPIILLEFKKVDWLFKYASFYYSLLSRGVLYVFLSFSISMNYSILNYSIALTIFLTGMIYIILHITPLADEYKFDTYQQQSYAMQDDLGLPTTMSDITDPFE